MSRNERIRAAVFLFFLGIFLYPSFSDAWNRKRSEALKTDYDSAVSSLGKEKLKKEWEDARKYNKAHTANYIQDVFSAERKKEDKKTQPYSSLLDPAGTGVMGELEIPKINLRLEIYHGTGEESLSKGCGHIEGTSLPVGGSGTHAVLAAHRGLAKAKLFTDLDQMKKGDVFYITVLNHRLAYRTDQILTAEPDDTEALKIESGKDYVTLLTCTPYAVNTQRLLVRGRRISLKEAENRSKSGTGFRTSERDMLTACAAAVLTALMAVRLIRSRRKKREAESQKK